jgi:uncharacterized membrane protein YidH (DUF202 family)
MRNLSLGVWGVVQTLKLHGRRLQLAKRLFLAWYRTRIGLVLDYPAERAIFLLDQYQTDAWRSDKPANNSDLEPA